MKAKKANIFILASLADIAWLLNIRGNDIHCCPVVLSYLVVTDAELRLYANAAAFSEEIRTNLAADGVKSIRMRMSILMFRQSQRIKKSCFPKTVSTAVW